MDGLTLIVELIFYLLAPLIPSLPGGTFFVGKEFRSVPYRYDPSDQGAVFQTSRFTIVFEDLKISSSGSGGGMTISGHHGLIPRFWDGYAKGEHSGTEQRILPSGKVSDERVRRIYFRHDFDPNLGIASLEFYGRRFSVHSAGRKLRIDKTDLDLPAAPGLILVDRKGKARLASPDEAKNLRKKLEKQVGESISPPP